MTEPQAQPIFILPEDVWEGGGDTSQNSKTNTHAFYRRTTAGKIFNLGPSQPYKSLSKEIKNSPYKYADVTGTSFDMYLNIIPGMHPFYWDLFSAIITPAAPVLGFIDGLFDHNIAEAKASAIYERIAKGGVEYYKTIVAAVDYKNKWLDSLEEKKKKEEAEKKVTKNSNAFVDDIVWGKGAYAEQVTTVKGLIEGARIARIHGHND
jgi:hypothetical protein